MASTYSTDLKLELMITGENAGTWGTKTNSNLNLLQQAIAGYQAISIAGGSQTTALVMSNAEISTARNAVVKLTGTITGNQIVTIPNGIEKTYIIENGTTGAFTVQFTTVSGTGPTFSTTDKGIKIVYSDGTNVVDVNANLSGPTLASDLDVNGKSIISTSNGNIVLAPNGTGDVQLDADTVRIGDSNANATLTTNGTGDLILNTNSGSNSGSITIKDGVNGDIEITPNGSGVVKLDGLSYPTTDGSADQVLKTNGSGVISFGTISSSPTQLVQSIPLKTGASYTAGQLASINASGEITTFPVLNTFGTARTNSNSTAYSTINDNGATAIRFTTSGSLSSSTATYTGIAISNSTNPTTGGTTVDDSQFVANGGSAGAIAIGSDKFLGFLRGSRAELCPGSDGRVGLYVITVNNSTGNCTKGTNRDFSSTKASINFTTTAFEIARITPNLFFFNWQNDGNSTAKGILTISGTTITYTADNDAEGFSGANGSNTILTTNNIIGYGTAGNWKTAAFTASPAGIGTVTTTAQVGDYLSNGAWAKMGVLGTDTADYVITTYTNTSGAARYITYSVNQTTGALTQVETGPLTDINNATADTFVFKDKNSFIGRGSSANGTSFAFTNGAKNNPTFNTPYTFGVMRYNSSDLFYSFSTSLSGFPTNTGYTVVAYGTDTFNYVGVAKTTDSTSPIDIVTDGVANGFTSLTPGTIYYATTPADGTVTTSSASGLLIGKAISSTEILLQRSNAQ